MEINIKGKKYKVEIHRGESTGLIAYRVLVGDTKVNVFPHATVNDSFIWKDQIGQTNELYQAIGEYIEKIEM